MSRQMGEGGGKEEGPGVEGQCGVETWRGSHILTSQTGGENARGRRLAGLNIRRLQMNLSSTSATMVILLPLRF